MVRFCYQIFLFVILFIGLQVPLHAQIEFVDASESLLIGDQVSLLSDSSFSVEQAFYSKAFTPSKEPTPSFEHGKDVWNWVRFDLTNTSQATELRLVIHQAIIDHIQLYQLSPSGFFIGDTISQQLPFAARKHNHPTPVFDLYIKQGETKTFLLKLNGKEKYFLPIAVMTPDKMREELGTTDLSISFYVGVLLAMLIFNFFVFVKVRDKSYLFYFVNIISTGITQVLVEGYTFKYLWPNVMWLEEYSIFIFPGITGITTLLFFRSFLNVRAHLGKYENITWVLISAYVLLVFLPALLGSFSFSFQMLLIVASLIAPYLLTITIILSVKRVKNARIFAIAWFVFIIGVTIYMLRDLGILPYNNFTRYTILIGSGLEMILITYAMIERLQQSEKEKISAQKRVLEAYEKQEALLREQDLAIALQVNARTQDLVSDNQELKDSLLELERIQQERLSDLSNEKSKLTHKNLQLQMNPHFLFNSLVSIQKMVLASNRLEASNYLSSYARLMRSVLENSRQDTIALDLELQCLKEYLALEQLRFKNRFEFKILIDERIETELVSIPPMIIQPYVENAILHGFLQQESIGKLSLDLSLNSSNQLLCIIEDNGIGRAAAQKLKVFTNKQSIGIQSTMKRLNLLGQHLDEKASITIEDLSMDNKPCGTKVEITLPML